MHELVDCLSARTFGLDFAAVFDREGHACWRGGSGMLSGFTRLASPKDFNHYLGTSRDHWLRLPAGAREPAERAGPRRDHPVLDVSVQAVVLGVRALGLSLLLITHDLVVVASGADEVVAPERGRVPERGRWARILTSPQDSYGAGCLTPRRRIDPGTPVDA
jgi:hypothetical protein